MVLANMWFQTLMRQFFFNLDKIVFNFIPTIYNFLIDLSRTSILSQADILDMADRIYKLLAVFMVFKVTFSLIMYVVNPDDFSDKTKGISKLGTNIIISLALLILTPYLFNYAYKLQNILLEDNSMATLVLGNKNDESENFFNTAGDTMAYMTLVPFFAPDSSISSGGTVDGIYECSKLTLSSNGKEQFNPACSGISNDDFTPNGADNETLYSLTKDNEKFSFQTLKNYVAGVNNKNLGLTFRQDLAVATYTADDEEVFIMDYKYLISTVVGVVTVLLLITFCMDVAVRSIKLAFLQLIAPIPIISYVDPKSGKDGLFKKWYTMCFQTFISLFVRLLALYFAIYIISRVDSLTDIIDGSYKSGAILKIFVVIGALMFAKQLPNILKGLGIKLDGDGKFTLNPLKKFENEALGGKSFGKFRDKHNLNAKGAFGAAKGLAAGTMIGTAGALTGAGAGRAFAGALSGMRAGAKGKKMSEIRKDQATKNAEMRRAIAAGSSFKERLGARYSSFMGTPGRLGIIEHDRMVAQNEIDRRKQEKSQNVNRIQKYKREQAAKKSEIAAIDALKNRAASQIEKGEGGKATKVYLDAKNKYEQMKNQGVVTERRDATSEEIGAAQDRLDKMKSGYDKHRPATDAEIRAKQAEIDKIKAGSRIVGADGKPIVDKVALSKAEADLNELRTNGVTEKVHYSEDEIKKAEEDLNNLKEKGVIETRQVSVEEITEAQIEYQKKQKEAQLQFITDVLDESNTAVTDDVLANGFENYKNLVGDAALKDGNALNVRGGVLQSEYDEIQRTEISAIERENERLDDEIAIEESKIAKYNAEKEDAKASQQVVHGVDSGPSNPKEISRNNPNTRNYRYNYREGGSGSGVEVFESGDIGPDGPPPQGGGHHHH